MLVSYLSHENADVPTSLLVPGLCWSPYYQMSLGKLLSQHSVSTAGSLQPGRSEHFLQHVLVLADLVCPGVGDLLETANKDLLFKSPYRWLLLDYEVPEQNKHLLQVIDILVDSNVVVVRRSNHGFTFTEAYKINETSELIEHARGSWRPIYNVPATTYKSIGQERHEKINNTVIITEDGDEMVRITAFIRKIKVDKYGIMEDYRQSKVISSRRHDLRRHVLTMSNILIETNETMKHMNDRLDLHHDSITKMSYMVVSICFDMLNATERLIFTNSWGYRNQTGHWQGQINSLLTKDADLGTLTIFTQERMQVIDYVAMVGRTAVRFVFREPPLAYVANIFALPFTGAVWLAILICVLGCALLLYVTSKWEASMGMHPLQLDGSWADVLILIIGAVLQQGCTLEPRHAAGRVVTLLLFISLTILYAAYSANIVVLLRAPSSSVRTLTDLLNSPLSVGASDFEYNRNFFKKLNEPIRKEIYDKKIAPKGKKPNFYSMKEGIQKIREGLFAFHMELNPGYRLIQDSYQEDEKCDLKEIDYINEIDPWVPGQKRGHFRDLFKINFMKIRESGIQACIHHRLHVPKPKCSYGVSSFSSVGVTDIYPALLITLYGFLVAPVTLLLEITYKQLLRVREKRKALEKINFTE
ncbi:hypothetical protein JYU34_014162 [Plutella xylostella]|uniref:Ionotropic glutamate receptor C-terminal domain-containing protein n=1 Tax=Plutella xylostella TaxID=51655 RepID=A0ABQ7Q7P6_PLUXY|nr:hypothetical protein JYU34_014162 [Plutella xylostella]